MATPVSIDSNVTGLSIAEEATLKTLPGTPVWYGLEPNTYSDFGAKFTSVARETINATRQRLKGTITDQEQKGGFNVDLTQRNLTRFLMGFFFADAFEKPATQPFVGTQVPITSVSATQYVAASGLGGFKTNGLISAKGFGVATNNGAPKLVTAVAAGALTVAGLTVEASPPAAAMLETVGIRGASGDISLALVGGLPQLQSVALDFTTLGLQVGEWIFLGADNVANRFNTSDPTTNTNNGFGRIGTLAAHAIQFDLCTFTPAADAGAGKLIDIYFGKVIHNAITPQLVKRRTYQLERLLGNDGVGIQSEYLVGAVADQFNLTINQASKITVDVNYVGMDVEQRDG